jgi:hypothetical protein
VKWQSSQLVWPRPMRTHTVPARKTVVVEFQMRAATQSAFKIHNQQSHVMTSQLHIGGLNSKFFPTLLAYDALLLQLGLASDLSGDLLLQCTVSECMSWLTSVTHLLGLADDLVARGGGVPCICPWM